MKTNKRRTSLPKPKHGPSPNLTLRPPRSPRVRLGGFALLPRLLDKGRAFLAKTNGEYNYNCPLDQHFFRFAGIDATAMLKQLSLGKGDGEILHWVHEHSRTKPSFWQIQAWSAFHDSRVPADTDTRAFFNEYHKKVGKNREDIATWFDVLDLDDYVSFGGRA